ncbi:HdeD family acid-resistance protein [Pseudoalteromonas sp. H105]|jgi:uncharacterized membrane protein HdeD (DUF308 family)|uniref:HdeD family acid-resistance protein n=1 Tax=Pseudoalteromonas sp. H105 TaxID=1348393 RepID=UPI000732400A|nr:DUF308 domain-containing protein [Pseudoalteromonas sp. H105]KTF16263.1 hypothetical protein ATS75_07665 [Pseudoalteromonas sp. H105]
MTLKNTLSKNWSLLFVRGFIAVIFGVITWFAPEVSLKIMLLFFSGYFLFDGILRVWVAWNSKQQNPYWHWLLFAGGLSIIAGLVSLFAPNVTAILLLYYVAAWAIAIGAVEIIIAIRLKAEIAGEWFLIITGAISVFFGVYLVFNPSAGIHALLWLVATYAVIFGSLIMGFSLKLKKLAA